MEWHESLSEALDYVAHDGIDIILLDMSLLDNKRISDLVKIRAKGSNVPIIILTGLDDEMVGTHVVYEGA